MWGEMLSAMAALVHFHIFSQFNVAKLESETDKWSKEAKLCGGKVQLPSVHRGEGAGLQWNSPKLNPIQI